MIIVPCDIKRWLPCNVPSMHANFEGFLIEKCRLAMAFLGVRYYCCQPLFIPGEKHCYFDQYNESCSESKSWLRSSESATLTMQNLVADWGILL